MRLILIALSFLLTVTIQAQTTKNALVYTGGKKFERDAFIQMFQTLNGIDFTERFQKDGTVDFTASDLNNFDVLVFYNVSQTISETQKEAFLSLLKTGKPILFLHHAIVCYQDWPTYENIVGGKYYHARKDKDSSLVIPSTYKHDEHIPVSIVDPTHPVTKDMNDFVILDEVYNKFNIHKGVTPLLKTTHPDSEPVIAWTHHYGNAPIVFIQLGHDHQAYNDKNYKQLVENSILWLAEQP